MPESLLILILSLNFEPIQKSGTARQKYKKYMEAFTHTQLFYGSVEFVRENPGEPVPEETFTHYSHRSHQSSLSAFSI